MEVKNLEEAILTLKDMLENNVDLEDILITEE